ncbi:Cna B-type domain-containing protein [Vagococcus fluvialis]|uniref:SpaA isopeptide-forming pilin-related protein n=1 Tax=Vagococcus fluvialis TaxID=2738 RepID=UPI001A8C6A61|nr:SpaA isopeptide-forming pilin-related protein [Vagococcus fluvialis]MBO0480287.1 Cna B-type domain-containing protein [Vagococcus fluvialis]MBO0485582.1 Cna B-type domain-containing protein [Vagococcus fluvialis]
MKKKQKLGILLLLTLVFNLILPVVSQANELLQGVSSFQYTADGDRGGAFPLNNTKVFKNVEENENVKNFDYSDVGYQDFPNTKYIVPNVSAFDGGYHTYIDANGMEIYTKKTVKPTDDPTKFNIELDVISGKNLNQEKLDIVFVFDKSSSMNEMVTRGKSRWDALKESFNFFNNDFFNDNSLDVQIGLSSFGTKNSQPYYEIAKNKNGYFFNKDSLYLLNNNNLMQKIPGHDTSNGSGTPTFTGVDAGFEILNNARIDSKKFLIFLTDGAPTYSPTKNYSSFYQTSKNNMFSVSGDSTFERYTLNKSIRSGRYTYDLFDRTTNTDILIPYIDSKYSSRSDIQKYSVGISQDIAKTEDVLNALGPNGMYQVTDNIETQLQKTLIDIKGEIIKSVAPISNATIVDPMSDYVEIVPGTVQENQLILDDNELIVIPENASDYLKKTDVIDSGSQLTVNNLTLKGSRDKSEGYRLNYQVTLKEAYRDGSFYPANKKTYIVDKNHPDGIEFAVPSVKNKEVKDIKVTKVWKGDNPNHPKIKLSLMVGDQQIGDSVELHKGQTEHIFTELPVYDESGELIEYEVREDKVPGYEEGVVTKEKDGSFMITNYPKGDFEATKSVDKDILKPGEEFTYTISVTNSVTDSTLKNLVVEDIIPDTLEVVSNAFLNGQDLGVISANQLNVTIPELKGKEVANITFKVKVKDTTPVGEIINKAKITNPEEPDKPKEPEVPVTVIRETDIHLLKTSMDGTTILPNATFLIQNLADKSETEATTDNSGKIIFSKLTPGDYLIKEKKAPDGFKVMRDPIKITIDKFGVVSVTESNESFVSTNTVENKFEIKVKNEERGILPLTGGNGHIEYLVPAAILFSSSLLLSIYYLFRRRKGWN